MVHRTKDFEVVSYELAASLLDYDPQTGTLRWKSHGRQAGHRGKFYIECRVRGRCVLGHRLAWLLHYREWPPSGFDVDHINRDKHDNRIENLRVLSRQENFRNSQRFDSAGVSFCRQTCLWKAYVTIDYKQRWLGRFATQEEAIKARQNAVSGL